ncbi:MAG: thiosulfate oxidation carrier protein SoxY [Piscirickettsiaceae bacterium]|jgi:sulfur-oxidizing protein SoxY|nr:thiosulfate oxidation carrier protein SoxY [Piscirickettsiaceae bacterium]
MQRRLLLKGLLGFTTMAAAMTAMPRLAMAKWSKAFDSTTVDGALNDLYGSAALTKDDKITLKVPEIAENGAVVPVTVKTKMANVTNISIFADKNPQPLAASFTLPEGTAPNVSIRIRLGETQVVKAVVEADGKLYTTEQEVKVTIGGCGG